ncbi:MAG TPA: tRNA lysidine(34) synthetase TilS, partial [Steroidobacteraceae bacterium]|nr:tRNA lysidine(34) synthetase TilS [Steroidobacteraceae bacterium]
MSEDAPSFERRVLTSLAAALADQRRAGLCVAFSGGVDSTALLTVLARSPLRGQLRALHVNHGLRPRAPAWSRHCQRVARSLRVPFELIELAGVAPAGASPEAAAREARYRALAQALAPAEVLLTGQHADDQLETVLLQLLRGAGVAGIAAMPARAAFAHGLLVRPLLGFTRAQILAYARARSLAWVEDDSNADERYDRNYLRRRVLPLILGRWPQAARTVARSARHAAEAQGLLDELARAAVERAAIGAALDVRRLRALSQAQRRNALRYWIAAAGFALPDAARLAELAGPVLGARRDAHPWVGWGTVRAERHTDQLRLSGARTALALAPTAWRLQRGVGTLELPAGLGRLEIVRDGRGPLDLQALPRELTV